MIASIVLTRFVSAFMIFRGTEFCFGALADVLSARLFVLKVFVLYFGYHFDVHDRCMSMHQVGSTAIVFSGASVWLDLGGLPGALGLGRVVEREWCAFICG